MQTSHRDEVVLTRLCIGKFFFTEIRTMTRVCTMSVSIDHEALITRRVTTLKELFNDISCETVLDFLREVQLFDKIRFLHQLYHGF